MFVELNVTRLKPIDLLRLQHGYQMHGQTLQANSSKIFIFLCYNAIYYAVIFKSR